MRTRGIFSHVCLVSLATKSGPFSGRWFLCSLKVMLQEKALAAIDFLYSTKIPAGTLSPPQGSEKEVKERGGGGRGRGSPSLLCVSVCPPWGCILAFVLPTNTPETCCLPCMEPVLPTGHKERASDEKVLRVSCIQMVQTLICDANSMCKSPPSLSVHSAVSLAPHPIPLSACQPQVLG